ncbi:hypothetical protein AB0J86_04930 [Micromonospora sp. NPDC049559]|uniref:hypothetical protein n=1 Tax=Micromonospora sp. NPDC049559 TaxID=3155923 RepID=UPI0034182A59
MEVLPLLLGVGCLGATALFVVVWVLNSARERRRRDRLTRWASQHGWTITPNPSVNWGSRLPGGNPRGVSLAISATVHGRQVSVAEYSYSETQTTTTSDGQGGTSVGQTTQTHAFTVVVVRLARSYPALAVEPRSSMSRLGRRLVGGGNATGHDEFDRKYRVDSADPGAVRRFVGPALIDEHLAGAVPPWSVYGPELLTYRPGAIEAPQHIPAMVGPLLRVAHHLDSRP